MTEDWRAAFAAALQRGDPLAASTILRGTGDDGIVGPERWAEARAIIAREGPAPFVRRDWASRLLAHPRRVDRALAAVLLEPLVTTHAAEVERAAARLARDERPDVREAAIALVVAGLERDAEWEEHGVPLLRELAADRDSSVARAASAALRRVQRRPGTSLS